MKLIPHIHRCEIKLCYPGLWKEKCILKGNLSESEDECEQCKHFIVINFDSESSTMITDIIRNDSLIVAEQSSSYNLRD